MVCTCSVTHSAIWKLITAIDGASATAGGTTEQAKAAARRKSRGTIPSGAPGGSPPGRLVSGVFRRDYMCALVPSSALGLPFNCGRRTRARLGAHRWDVGGESARRQYAIYAVRSLRWASTRRTRNGAGHLRGGVLELLFVHCGRKCQRCRRPPVESAVLVASCCATASTASSGSPPGG